MERLVVFMLAGKAFHRQPKALPGMLDQQVNLSIAGGEFRCDASAIAIKKAGKIGKPAEVIERFKDTQIGAATRRCDGSPPPKRRLPPDRRPGGVAVEAWPGDERDRFLFVEPINIDIPIVIHRN